VLHPAYQQIALLPAAPSSAGKPEQPCSRKPAAQQEWGKKQPSYPYFKLFPHRALKPGTLGVTALDRKVERCANAKIHRTAVFPFGHWPRRPLHSF
jgi:hypothetical protein